MYLTLARIGAAIVGGLGSLFRWVAQLNARRSIRDYGRLSRKLGRAETSNEALRKATKKAQRAREIDEEVDVLSDDDLDRELRS